MSALKEKLLAAINKAMRWLQRTWKELRLRWKSLSPGFRYAAVYFLCVICIASVVWWQFSPGNNLVFDPESGKPGTENPDDLVDLNPGDEGDELEDPENPGGEWALFVSGQNTISLPLQGNVLTAFGQTFQPYSEIAYYTMLEGVHIGGTCGDWICAAWQGTVAEVQESEGNGHGIVVLDHGDWKTKYINISEIDVKTGDKVTAGQRLGMLADTKAYSGDFLEFQVWGADGQPANPYLYLGLDR